MNLIFLTGIAGSLVLVTGAAWPETRITRPVQSVKNWLFAIGGFIMLLYAYLGFREGGPVFFVILEILVGIASVLMMIDADDRIDAAVIGTGGGALIVWSLYLFEGYQTAIFIIGLAAVGLGYALKMGTLRRDLALTLGSATIAVFSYLEANWIFFWLNVFFAIFSGYYLLKKCR